MTDRGVNTETMLKSSDILKSTRDELKAKYPSYPVYLDETKEGFESPCFFLKLVSIRQPETRVRFKNTCTLYISFLCEKGKVDPLFIYDLKDDIYNTFYCGMQVKDRYLKFDSMHSESLGAESDSIQFELDFTYLDVIEEHETEWKIMHIHGVEKYKHADI